MLLIELDKLSEEVGLTQPELSGSFFTTFSTRVIDPLLDIRSLNLAITVQEFEDHRDMLRKGLLRDPETIRDEYTRLSNTIVEGSEYIVRASIGFNTCIIKRVVILNSFIYLDITSDNDSILLNSLVGISNFSGIYTRGFTNIWYPETRCSLKNCKISGNIESIGYYANMLTDNEYKTRAQYLLSVNFSTDNVLCNHCFWSADL